MALRPRTPRVENFGRPLGEVNGFQALFVLGFAKLETGWWFEPTPLKNDGVKVSWDYDIPN